MCSWGIPFDGHADLFSAVGHRLHNTGGGAPPKSAPQEAPPIGLGLPGVAPPQQATMVGAWQAFNYATVDLESN
jgi:hypothetical protein